MGVTLVWWKRRLPHAAAGCQKKSCRDQLSSPVHQQQVPMYSALCFDGARPTAFPSAATILLLFSYHTHHSYHGPRYVILPRCE